MKPTHWIVWINGNPSRPYLQRAAANGAAIVARAQGLAVTVQPVGF